MSATNRTWLTLKSDCISALQLAMSMRSKVGAGLLARELALELAISAFAPHFAVHIPGVTNCWTDDLSRLYAPEPHQIPPELSMSLRMPLRQIDRHYFSVLQSRSISGEY